MKNYKILVFPTNLNYQIVNALSTENVHKFLIVENRTYRLDDSDFTRFSDLCISFINYKNKKQ